jgi:hypothetical protein
MMGCCEFAHPHPRTELREHEKEKFFPGEGRLPWERGFSEGAFCRFPLLGPVLMIAFGSIRPDKISFFSLLLTLNM